MGTTPHFHHTYSAPPHRPPSTSKPSRLNFSLSQPRKSNDSSPPHSIHNATEEMAPPPVTPSPHRFLLKAPNRPAPLDAQSQASQGQQQPSPLATGSGSGRRRTENQFNAVPRFSFASSQRSATGRDNIAGIGRGHHVASGASVRLPRFRDVGVTPARKGKDGHVEVIEDLDDDDGDGDGERDADVLESVESSVLIGDEHEEEYDERALEEREDDYDLFTPAPKRRRISFSPIDSSSFHTNDVCEPNDYDDPNENDNGKNDHDNNDNDNNNDFNPSSSYQIPSPQQHQPFHRAPRFLSPHPTQPAPNSTPGPSFLKPPRFRQLDEQERSVPAEPLPEAFSPYRRGQKFLAGGLAAEVRGWLLEREDCGTAGRRNDGEWMVRLKIEEVTGGGAAGMTLVRGKLVGSGLSKTAEERGGVRMMLGGGEGMGEGLKKGELAAVGRVIGIKAPVWEVVVLGEKWGVGAAWKVLD